MTSPGGDVPPGGRGPEQVHELSNAQPPAMLNPDMYGLAEDARGNFIGRILSGFVSIGAAIAQFANDLVDAFFGNYEGTSPALQAFQDGQLALNQRLDLMEDISGYCATYQDHNWRVGGGTRRIPFGAKLGPNKNAHPGDDGIYLDAPGTWRIDATATAGSGDGTMPCRFIISVRDQNGDIYSEAWLDAELTTRRRTWAWSHTVVIEEPGYHVRVYWGHGALWWSLLGGTHLSRLSVNRWNIDTSDFVVDTDVPDGGDL